MGLRARRPGPLVAAIVVLIAATPTAVTTATAQASCDPIQTQPVYNPAIPTKALVLFGGRRLSFKAAAIRCAFRSRLSIAS